MKSGNIADSQRDVKSKMIPGAVFIKKAFDFWRVNGTKATLGKAVRRVRRKANTEWSVSNYYPNLEELEKQKKASQAGDAGTVKFSILVPLYNTPEQFLIEMIESVLAQSYKNWELCLADGSDSNSEWIENICCGYMTEDDRVKYIKLEENLGISGNTNKCVDIATGDYITLLDHDDILWPNALYENAAAIKITGADVLYSDEDRIGIDNSYHSSPFFKPDWSRDLLYSQNYICHLMVFKAELLEKAGLFNPAFDGSQDYDLVLRLSEYTELFYHIPKILYSWREQPSSTSTNPDSKPYAQNAGLDALNTHLNRRYCGVAEATPADMLFVWDTRFKTMTESPLISIIIPMKDNAILTDRCIQSIIGKSTYKNWEIILVDNGSSEEATFDWFERVKKQDTRISVIRADFEFNWSKVNNLGIKSARGDAFIFLNNDTIVITPDWIERLCENAFRDDIGAVGPLLIYEDGIIQHAGVVVGMGGWADNVFRGASAKHAHSPYVSPIVNRNVMAVTGACLCVSRRTIEKIGVFNEEFIVCGSDVELCIRAYENGLRNMYNANVRLYHLESKTRDSFIPKVDFEMSSEAYKNYRENTDPFFNPNLDINAVIPTALSSGCRRVDTYINYLKRNTGVLTGSGVEG